MALVRFSEVNSLQKLEDILWIDADQYILPEKFVKLAGIIEGIFTRKF